MLGRADAYDRLPYFFSDQYDVGMEYSGLARGWDRVVFRGDPAGREFIAFWIAEDRVVAGMNVNVWDVTDPIRRLIPERVQSTTGASPTPTSRSRRSADGQEASASTPATGPLRAPCPPSATVAFAVTRW